MTITSRHVRALLSAALLLTLTGGAARAQTQTAFSNFGPRDTFGSGGWLETGPAAMSGLNDPVSQGEGFTATATGDLSTIHIALENIGGLNDAHLFLAADGGGVPGTVLEEFTLTGVPYPQGLTTPDVAISALHPLLTAGTSYFLYESETGDEQNSWQFSLIGGQGTHVVSTGGGQFFSRSDTQGAFSVEVGPVPEASTSASLGLLLALGVGGVVAARRLKRPATTTTD